MPKTNVSTKDLVSQLIDGISQNLQTGRLEDAHMWAQVLVMVHESGLI